VSEAAPPEVLSREASARLKRRASLLSTVSNASLVALKLVVGLSIHSLSVLAEAAHSGLDLAASLICLFSIRRSLKPADHTHRYGHGKFESLGGLAEALLIFAVSVWVVYEAGKAMLSGEPPLRQPWIGAGVLLLSTIVNIIVSGIVMAAARRTGSPALEGNAWHIRSDVYTSAAVFVGLGVIAIGQLLGQHWLLHLDPILAIVVALLIVRIAWRMTKRNIAHLVDATLPEDELDTIREVIEAHYPAFVGYHRLRARHSGSEHYIDFHLEVPPQMSVAQAHELCDHLEEELRQVIPQAQVDIHIEPREVVESAAASGEAQR
jgi:cation diffusion facilitator family transporter